jgi:hypothetical protein
MASLKDRIKARKQYPNRVFAVGLSGVKQQDKRAKAAGAKGAAKEAVRRVGEYKRGKVSSEADYHSKEGKAKYKK